MLRMHESKGPSEDGMRLDFDLGRGCGCGCPGGVLEVRGSQAVWPRAKGGVSQEPWMANSAGGCKARRPAPGASGSEMAAREGIQGIKQGPWSEFYLPHRDALNKVLVDV